MREEMRGVKGTGMCGVHVPALFVESKKKQKAEWCRSDTGSKAPGLGWVSFHVTV